jgi:colanic acid/amylovoran biosynthesis glycosyltransferase
MRIAFLVDYFPSVSETFILNQITGLIDRGHEVDVYATRPPLTGLRNFVRQWWQGVDNEDPVHEAIREYNLLDRTYQAPTLPANPALRPLWDVPLIARSLLKAPTPTGRALQSFSYHNYPEHLRKPEYGLLYTMISVLESDTRRYDAIHCHFGPNGLRGLLLKKLELLDGPLLTTFHGYDVTRYPKVEGRDVYAPLFTRANGFTGGTQHLLAKATELGCPSHKCFKLPSGVDTNKFSFSPPTNQTGRNDSLQILSVARFTEEKGLKYSIAAIDKVRNSTSRPIRYKIVGDGVLRDELESQIREHELAESVELVGPLSQEAVSKCYTDSDIFLLPSIIGSNGEEEGQGLVVQEAQSTGLPVVATNIGGIPEGVLPDESAYLVPERDVDALADRLLYLIDHPEVRKEMGRKGRRFVEENYDNEILIDRLVEIYHRIA